MGLFKSLFGGNNTPETEKEKNDKKNFEILKYDGIRAQRMGKLPYAIKCFEEAVAINDELETLSLLATAYTQANRLDDARITLDRMATKDPEQVNTFLSLAGICYMQEDYENMKDACQKALVLDNKNPLSFYLTAKAAIGMKDDITAIAMLTKAIVLKEDYTEAYQLRAEVLWKMKQAKDAAEDIQKLLSLNPDDEQALLLKGEILAAYLALSGDWTHAVGLLLYCGLIVTNIDNLIRFILQKKMADTHPLITIFGVVIGLSLFGFMGVIFGPLLLSIFILCVNIFKTQYLK